MDVMIVILSQIRRQTFGNPNYFFQALGQGQINHGNDSNPGTFRKMCRLIQHHDSICNMARVLRLVIL